MLQTIAGHDPQDSTTFPMPVPNYRDVISNSLNGMVIGVPRHYIDEFNVGVDPEVRGSFDEALKSLQNSGARLEEVNISSLSYATIANSVIMLAEAFSYHQKTLQLEPQKYGQVAYDCFVLGGTYTSSDYQIAMRARSHIRREYAEVMRGVDLIATPSMATAAGDAQYDLLPLLTVPNFMGPMNQTGMPAISVPSGFTRDGLPIGLQLAGKPFEEAKVLNAAHIYQTQADLMDKRPWVDQLE
jgi:aspartyl-tRNA(Asn)/glutamyl-tRNA(Gln) amidotransferase subunit A